MLYNRTDYLITSCNCPAVSATADMILNNIILHNKDINADAIYNIYNTIIVDAVVISKTAQSMHLQTSDVADALRELRQAHIISKIKSDVYQLNAKYKSLYNTSDTQLIIAGAKPND